ncbi:hypothetical protein ADK52_35370 [Streptomyces sp. WM6372]|nr:hypothetical protein ADK52_35370 [Streptomyces sp. WM6372]
MSAGRTEGHTEQGDELCCRGWSLQGTQQMRSWDADEGVEGCCVGMGGGLPQGCYTASRVDQGFGPWFVDVYDEAGPDEHGRHQEKAVAFECHRVAGWMAFQLDGAVVPVHAVVEAVQGRCPAESGQAAGAVYDVVFAHGFEVVPVWGQQCVPGFVEGVGDAVDGVGALEDLPGAFVVDWVAGQPVVDLFPRLPRGRGFDRCEVLCPGLFHASRGLVDEADPAPRGLQGENGA